MPKSKWQSGGSMMLLLKLHPCVVTDEEFSSQRKLHTNIPQWGRADTSQHFQGTTNKTGSTALLLLQKCPQDLTTTSHLNSQLPASLLGLSSTSNNWSLIVLQNYTATQGTNTPAQPATETATYTENMGGTRSRQEIMYYEVPCFQERFKSGEIYKVKANPELQSIQNCRSFAKFQSLLQVYTILVLNTRSNNSLNCRVKSMYLWQIHDRRN